MKQRHAKHSRASARAVLASNNIAVGQNFFTIRADQVEGLLVEADRVRYQKPKAANGSRGRYFHDLLQRRAQAKVD